MINCILWVLLLLIFMVLLKCTNSPPIVSSIGTFNQNLVCYLLDLLPRFAPNDYSCKAFSFVSQIKNANFSRKILVSYDVTSLFNNVPLKETIDIAINLIFNHNPKIKVTKDEINFFSFLLNHRLNSKFFNSKFYNQIDGVAMGSPLAPVLANIFMAVYKSKWLNEYNLDKPTFCLRYVDDILAAFDKEQDSLKLLNF